MAANNIQVVIPAAGTGARCGCGGPKCLLEVGEESLISRQVRLLKRLIPGCKPVVVVGYQADAVRSHLRGRATLVVNEDYEDTNTAYSVALGLEVCEPGPVLVVYGDLVLRKEIIKPILKSAVSAVIIHQNSTRRQEVGATVVDGQVTYFAYGLTAKWGQVALLYEPERGFFTEAALRPEAARLFGFEILNKVLSWGGELLAVEVKQDQLEVDTVDDLKKASKALR